MSEDDRREEKSYQTIGKVGQVLFVVYTERKDAYRLISARIANGLKEKNK